MEIIRQTAPGKKEREVPVKTKKTQQSQPQLQWTLKQPTGRAGVPRYTGSLPRAARRQTAAGSGSATPRRSAGNEWEIISDYEPVCAKKSMQNRRFRAESVQDERHSVHAWADMLQLDWRKLL